MKRKQEEGITDRECEDNKKEYSVCVFECFGFFTTLLRNILIKEEGYIFIGWW